MIGTTLAGYRISAKLGQGGMGEVWKATDESLGREVALKLLPESMALDGDRLSRFELEARVLASLNHPNIATLFSLEMADERHLLVMELVEGPDLSDRIAEGSIPAQEAVAIARQIAEALEVAHEQGVVHRDLKPANIKVRDDGTVKVLDFGLAKAWKASQPGASSLSVSPTIPTPATAAGVILGTAAYMAPEQASGKSVDRRADIWSFGVVLWEMLAGSPIYQGDSVPEILASVLRDEPCFEELPDGLDARLVSLLERCLRRDPRRRLQAIGDARVELEDLASAPVPASASESKFVLGASPPGRRRAVVATASALVIVAAFLGWSIGRRGGSKVGSPSVQTFEVVEAGDVDLLEITNPRVSPDGQAVAFIGEDSSRKSALFLRSLDRLEIKKFEVAAGFAFFSPDGQSLGFFDLQERVLKKISLEDGLASVLVDPGFIPASWGEDNFVYYIPGRVNIENEASVRGLWRSSTITGKAEQLTTPEADEYHYSPALLPDGRSLIFSAGRGRLQAGWDLELLDLETGERKHLLEGVTQAFPAGDDHIVFWRDGRLFALPFDPRSREPTGNAEPVLEGVLQVARAQVHLGHFHVGPSGDLVYVKATGNDAPVVSKLVVRSLDGQEEDRVLDEAPNFLHLFACLSPDGRSLAAVRRSLSMTRKTEIWLFDLETGGRRSFASEGQINIWPVWSPDGGSLYYASDRQGSEAQIYRQELGGAARRLGEFKPGRAVPYAITADETLIWASRVGNEIRLGRTTPEGIDQWLTPEDKSFRFAGGVSLSPDDRWLVYNVVHESSTKLFLLDLESPDPVASELGIEGALSPFFSADGRSLYFRLPPYPARSSVHRARISAGSVVSLGEPEPMLEMPAVPGVVNPWMVDWIAVTPDERSVIYTEIETHGSGGRVVMIRNWVSTLGSE